MEQNLVKLGKNCMQYSTNLRQFAQRAYITLGAVEKGNNLLPFEI
jgi:hypothetical protein